MNRLRQQDVCNNPTTTIVPTVTLSYAERQFRDIRVDERVAYKSDNEVGNEDGDAHYNLNLGDEDEDHNIEGSDEFHPTEATTADPSPTTKESKGLNVLDYIQILDERVSRVESTLGEMKSDLLDVKVQFGPSLSYCICCAGHNNTHGYEHGGGFDELNHDDQDDYVHHPEPTTTTIQLETTTTTTTTTTHFSMCIRMRGGDSNIIPNTVITTSLPT
ncbi:unnamed protein product [Citrullus colocynthis]|uniref:Uncharacterized protein n=1 Tax=Citrullus colocynthis TaxID=252529 RepID=A0ABP0YB44_9ROSI